MISNDDIGAMKIHAIFQSGKRLKDFVDMYFLLDGKHSSNTSKPMKINIRETFSGYPFAFLLRQY